jgi:3D (Asp-Asp-Asp) domain-containing protein
MLFYLQVFSLPLQIYTHRPTKPVQNFSSRVSDNSNEAITPEFSLAVSSSIVPKTAVFYHGIKLGEFEGDNKTVKDVIDHFNITLDGNDVLNHSLDAVVSYGMNLEIDNVTYVEKVIKEVIPYSTVIVESQTVPKGVKKISREGVNGSSEKVVRTKHINGEATDEAVNFDRYVEPVDEEILLGVGGVFTAPDGIEYNYSYYLDVTATAYTHTGDPTYMGTVAEVGVIAVDPRNIKLGSDVYVIGNYGDYGVCRAEDIGGGIKGLRIDVFLDTEEECVIFGRRKMRVYILEK